jgi:AcrR family transcriptional regulator
VGHNFVGHNEVMSIEEHVARPKRKDAALNKDRLVQSAREVFARDGLSATLEDIARQAGVGVGTVYRNFASKREIVQTLYDSALDAALADVRAALEMEDPWLAIATFFEVTAASQARDRGLCEIILGRDAQHLGETIAGDLVDALRQLFDRASAAGVLRDGVSYTDCWPIFAMLYGIYGAIDGSPELWRRYLALILDGLRAGDRPSLPLPAPDGDWFAMALSVAD